MSDFIITPEQYKKKKSLPLKKKIDLSLSVIQEWYEHFDGKVFVSFSGGLDSTALLNLVRSIYDDVPAVFVNTGLEYPEIIRFVKSIDNVVILHPKITFKEVIDKVGYPIISKDVSSIIHLYRDKNVYKIPKKYTYLAKADFKISDKCCSYLKKQPLNRYTFYSGRKPFVGFLAEESNLRLLHYYKTGCNSFNSNKVKSSPLSFWTRIDIMEYIVQNNIEYSKIYDMGYERTGCMFCGFGIHISESPNKFELMKITHPKHYKYCMDELNLKHVFEFMQNDGLINFKY